MSDKKPSQADANATQDTVAPDPKGTHDEKQVNIPVSASNALTPEAGIQIKVDTNDTKKVIKTDAYDRQKTKAQAEFKDHEDLHDAIRNNGDLANENLGNLSSNKTHPFLTNNSADAADVKLD